MSTIKAKTITFRSLDGETFVVDEAVALQCLTIKNGLKHVVDDQNNIIPVHNVDGKTLTRVMEYCKKHMKESDEDEDEDDMKKWDQEFVDVDEAILYNLFMGANYLNIPSLLDLVASKVADIIHDMKVEEIRKKFKIKNDFTPEEEEEMRKENPWAFQ